MTVTDILARTKPWTDAISDTIAHMVYIVTITDSIAYIVCTAAIADTMAYRIAANYSTLLFFNSCHRPLVIHAVGGVFRCST